MLQNIFKKIFRFDGQLILEQKHIDTKFDVQKALEAFENLE